MGDSAPTATAWSTGKRTQDGRLSQGPSAADNVPGTNEGYRTYMEIARDRGKATGNVSTAEITDATPAGPSSHISQRACQGPADARTTCPTEAKTAGGLGSIAEQQVDQGFDLYLGGGRGRYAQTLAAGGTDTVIDYAEDEGYDVVGTKAELAAVDSLDTPVIGLFNNANMTTEYAPLYARNQAYYDANPLPGRNVQVQGGSETTRCQTQDRGTEPSLPEMTAKAIELLSADPDGFTLQVEGASIDKRDHAADLCGQIGETLAFDDAIGVALDYQRDHPDTLVIVTADHAHTSQMTYATGALPPSTSHATVQTVDGAPIRVAYGTAETGSARRRAARSRTRAPRSRCGRSARRRRTSRARSTRRTSSACSTARRRASSRAPAPRAATASRARPARPAAGRAQGPQGTPGPAGAAGARGRRRPAGAQGVAGRDGRDGRDGVLTCKPTGRRRSRARSPPPGRARRRSSSARAGRWPAPPSAGASSSSAARRR